MNIISRSNEKIVEENERYAEIYQIKCIPSGKLYIGQAVSHIPHQSKYRRWGMEKRFSSHISEAFSSKKNQCHYLNNSIRKYGKDNFSVELIEICQIKDADDREAFYIQEYNTMFPNGYNLKLGTITTRLSDEGRRRVSDGVHRYYEEQKFTRFLDIDTRLIEQDISYHIRPLHRHKVQYG